jgi:hypothetical protein
MKLPRSSSPQCGNAEHDGPDRRTARVGRLLVCGVQSAVVGRWSVPGIRHHFRGPVNGSTLASLGIRTARKRLQFGSCSTFETSVPCQHLGPD